MRNAKPYSRRKSLYQTQNLTPNTKHWSNAKPYSNAKLRSEHKTFHQTQNLVGRGAGVVYISTRLCFKVYYEPFIANLFSMFNIMISPCRRCIGTVFSAKSVKKFPLRVFFFWPEGSAKPYSYRKTQNVWDVNFCTFSQRFR